MRGRGGGKWPPASGVEETVRGPFMGASCLAGAATLPDVVGTRRSHPLEPEVPPRAVHHGRRDLGNAALPSIVRVDALHHAADEARDVREPLLRVVAPHDAAGRA